MSNELVKLEKVSDDCCGSLVTQSHYPWGTSLYFENELVDKLGIGQLQPGDIVEVRAFAIVESISEQSDANRSRKSVGVQLTDISVSRKQTDNDYAQQLYGG